MGVRDTLRVLKMQCEKCSKICEVVKWDSDESQERCPCDEKAILRYQPPTPSNSAPVQVGKYKNGRPAHEKRSRSREHFKKEIYPYLNPSDQKMFKNKYSDLK